MTAVLLVNGCVIPAPDSTESLDVPTRAVEGAGQDCRGGALVTNDPPVHRCETDGGPVFFTVLRDCSLPEKFSHQATTRQLLVGVTNLHVARQEPVAFGDRKALHSLVDGIIDVDPVLMSNFAFRNGDCMTDLALWRILTSPHPAPEEAEAFSALSRRLAERLVTNGVLGDSGDSSNQGNSEAHGAG